MRVFIFGSTGMLGNYVLKYLRDFYECIAISRQECDVNDLTSSTLSDLFKKYSIRGDVLVNCIGVIPHTLNEKSSKTYFKVNSIFPIILGKLAEKTECKMVHITTDCVFDGKDGNYTEESAHSALDDYGVSKSLGEMCDQTIIRCSIIGEEKYNKRSLLEWVKSNRGKTINGFKNFYWNGITCLELAHFIRHLIEKNGFWKGVRHLHSPFSLTKHELCCIINDIFNLEIKVIPTDFPKEVKNMTLGSKFSSDYKISGIREQISRLKEFDILNKQ